jgi:hypothetical protein
MESRTSRKPLDGRLGISFSAADGISIPAFAPPRPLPGGIHMPRRFPLFALMAMLATATQVLGQNAVSPDTVMVGRPVFVLSQSSLPPAGQFIWPPIPNVCSGESTLDLQYAAHMQSQTALVRVFLPDDTFGLSSSDPWKTVPIPDLTGWRVSLAVLEETMHREPMDVPLGPPIHGDFGLPVRKNQSQVFNIAIGTQF